MNLSIIIVTYNSAGVIRDCLESLGPWAKHALVVDNASSDQTTELVRARGVRLLDMPGNLGFARAVNQGVRASKGQAVCLLNPDCLATPELFYLGLDALRSGEKLIAAPALDDHGQTVPGRQPGYSRLKLAHDLMVLGWPCPQSLTWMPRLPGYHDRSWHWAHGACLFIRRDLFLSLGGLAINYFMYMEDVELGLKLHQAGGRVVELPYNMPHLTAQGAKVTDARRRWLLARGRLKYAAKHYGYIFAVGLGLITLPGMWAKGVRK
ncbi:MAG: glycosyltransferase family 2 protein [Desulfarculaceae bacterium]|nr:glycosyltransferase family 2 protein [Desulfarculaceae bacterium]MCF8049242.1 glycosyltransferase family 2 protein [Desulfarculaceae bacterium]MCF8065776.1 glycosyltransferase family 2 protein [Desulfarculaceae bacterium]MCF8097615.1 glycosyltransferase family 2 protein [Desulfarculaceae bacterium]MCF8122387.1 glycosyltransferase family 2 protein [Desulfarculaceae bacterium]